MALVISCLSPATVVLLLLLLLETWRTAEGIVPAMYVFGDSTVDVGNNNFLNGNFDTKANFRPNGVDFPGGRPTGRFGNGLIGVDFLAQRLGFEQSPPPVLSINNPLEELRGVNFASGGSGIADSTGEAVSLSMNRQIGLYEDVVRRLVSLRGSAGASLFLSQSIFLFSVGNNDMFTYYESSGAQNQNANDMFSSSLIYQLQNQIRRLHSLGARKFAIFGNGLGGCIPAFRSLNPLGECVGVLNEMGRRFNDGTRKMLSDLQSNLEGMQYAFADTFQISDYILMNAAQLGFKEVRSACCGGGFLKGQTSCGPGSTFCSNRDEYLTWDHAHPTQANHKLIIELAFNGGQQFITPMNINQLASL